MLIRAAVKKFDDVVEIPASSAVLYAASNVIGDVCYNENNTFMKCKADNDSPIPCIDAGKNVTSCGLGVLRGIYGGPCADPFKAYVTALEKRNLQFDYTRTEEKAFVSCMERNK